MFGNHSYETAAKIAEQKTKETGVTHAALPCGDEAPGLWTVGRELKALSGEEFERMLLAQAAGVKAGPKPPGE